MGEPLLFLLVAGAGVAVGLARGGEVAGLADPGVRSRWLALGCLALQQRRCGGGQGDARHGNDRFLDSGVEGPVYRRAIASARTPTEIA